ncbi:DNA-directed RNA polymerase subunit M [Halalkalicoccus paucihalophilus]|uniref:Transcription factor S n=1 Tax=Halalkalicoccus paucihalophilus TaxID=1008153 RepID=A0A151AF68_9EURY|nr:transcription factor S [Halalkalicoccus paucihalophilus]KYH26321.1 DNA-directed RNA polymerase subunit M [Halalkalicoccus paucihalophilus]
MQFCPECGSMMKAEGEEWVCGSCGETVARDREAESEFVSTETQSGDELIETEEGVEFEGKPTAKDVTCEECGHGEAWYTIKQTGAADEPPTRFFKCKECGYRWREYN